MRPLSVFTLAVALAGCSPDGEGATPTPTGEPCTFAASASGAADLVVVGAGSCAGTTTFHLRVATGDPEAPTWSDAASAPVRVHGAWRAEGGGLVRSVEVENTSGGDVALVGLEWSADPLGVAADRLLHQGYQSWTYTGVEAIPDAVGEALGTARPGGDGESSIAEQAGVSWWLGAVMNERGHGLLVGADGGTVLPTFVAADGRRLRVVQGLRGDAVPLASGQRRALDGLYLALGDVTAKLDAYAAYVARLYPPTAPRRPALGGWGSWNLYYADIDATKLREEASWAGATLAPLGLTTLLLDDGYEPRWGAWEASPAFGAELGALNAEQAALGLSPAVWLAPIYIDVEDSLVVEHPDWFVKKPSGALRTFNNFGPTYAALDVTRAEARAHVAGAIARFRDLGYRAIKIDFLFGAAIAGRRSAELTGLESYQRWMSVIREAAGELHVIGCGAPILPSVSWVDSMRTGPDVAFVTSPEATWPFVASQARHTAHRAFTDAWWSLDPDVVLLRGAKLSDAEAWTFVVSSALAGGNWLSGDGRQAPAARLAMMLAPEILALTRDGHAARPADLAAGMDAGPVGSPLLLGTAEVAVPHVWKKAGAVAVFGWEADAYSVRLELPPGARELVAEGGAVVSRPAPSDTITVTRHAARLFVE